MRMHTAVAYRSHTARRWPPWLASLLVSAVLLGLFSGLAASVQAQNPSAAGKPVAGAAASGSTFAQEAIGNVLAGRQETREPQFFVSHGAAAVHTSVSSDEVPELRPGWQALSFPEAVINNTEGGIPPGAGTPVAAGSVDQPQAPRSWLQWSFGWALQKLPRQSPSRRLQAASRNALDPALPANSINSVNGTHPFPEGRHSSGPEDLEVECAEIDSQPDPCAFVLQNCSSSSGLINYLEFYYCDIPNNAVERGLGVFLLVLILLFLFCALALTAEDFFCPCLSIISDSLKLSENVAGVTVLALGNGASDLVSTFIASQKGARQMAVGELLGAGCFVTSIVVGTIAILTPSFALARRPFLRDVGFYVFSVLCLAVFLFDGDIKLWESLMLILIYLIYVCTVIIGRNIYQSRKKKRLEMEEAKRRLEAQAAPPAASTAASSYGNNIITSEQPLIIVEDDPEIAFGDAEYEEYECHADHSEKASMHSADAPSFVIDGPMDELPLLGDQSHTAAGQLHLQVPRALSPSSTLTVPSPPRSRAVSSRSQGEPARHASSDDEKTAQAHRRRRLSSHSFHAGDEPSATANRIVAGGPLSAPHKYKTVSRSRSAANAGEGGLSALSPTLPSSGMLSPRGSRTGHISRRSFGGNTGVRSPMTTLAIIRDRALHYGDVTPSHLGISIFPDIPPVAASRRASAWQVSTGEDGAQTETKKMRRMQNPNRYAAGPQSAGGMPSTVEIGGETVHTARWRRYAEEERAEREAGEVADDEETSLGVPSLPTSRRSSGYSRVRDDDAEKYGRSGSHPRSDSAGNDLRSGAAESSTMVENKPAGADEIPSPSMSMDSQDSAAGGLSIAADGTVTMVYERKSQLLSLMHTLFPLPFVWKRKGIVGRIVSIICVPIIFSLGCTVLVVLDDVDEETEEESGEDDDAGHADRKSSAGPADLSLDLGVASNRHHASHHHHHQAFMAESNPVVPIIPDDDDDEEAEDDEDNDESALLGGNHSRATASASSGAALTVTSTDVDSDEDEGGALLGSSRRASVSAANANRLLRPGRAGKKKADKVSFVAVPRPPGPIKRAWLNFCRRAHSVLFMGKRPKGVPVGGDAWNRWCIILQAFAGPTFVALAVTEGQVTVGSFPTWCFGPIIGLILSLFIALSTSNDMVPKWYRLLAYPGFIVAMVWIYLFANEIVGLLETFGRVFDISDALLGMTVLAMGNSIGDTVSNIAIARMGYPTMAVSACFGAPMLNMLLGIGISSLAIIAGQAEQFTLSFSPSLMLSLGVLVTVLTSDLMLVPLLGFRFTRGHGYFLVILYALFTVGNIALELIF